MKPQDDKKVIMDAVRCGGCDGIGYKLVKRKVGDKKKVGGWEACQECNKAGRKVIRVIGDGAGKKVCGIGTGIETPASSEAGSELDN